VGKTDTGVALCWCGRENVEDRSISFLFLRIRVVVYCYHGSESRIIVCVVG
jgi:hypothetical protein